MHSQEKSKYKIKRFEFKEGVLIEELYYMNPALMVLFSALINFCSDNNLYCKLTSIYRPPNDGFSKSDTHQTYRAFDLSVGGWTHGDIIACVEYFNENYLKYGAVVDKNTRRVVLFHDVGKGAHIHFQIDRKYSLRKNVNHK